MPGQEPNWEATARRSMRKFGGILLMGLALTIATQTPAGAQSTPTLSVNASTGHHSINPNVYGFGASTGTTLSTPFLASLQTTYFRIGGDAMSNYSYVADSSNAGNDLYFVNSNAGTPTPGKAYDYDISALRTAMPSISVSVTIPINPWIALGGAPLCSYPNPPYSGEGAYFNYSGLSCGTGALAGASVSDTTLTYNYQPNSTAEEQSWIAHLKSTWGSCSGGGICMYQLDNEPGGWSNTHHDWQPSGASYSTITSDGETYAKAVVSADAAALTFGPSDYYLDFGGVVSNSPTSDPSMVYYLKQFASADATFGKQTLGWLDEHWVVGCPNVGVGPCSSVQNDFDEIRELWDPTLSSYPNTQRFASYSAQNAALGLSNNEELIPRMQAYISSFYPAVKGFGISEYEVNHYNNSSFPVIQHGQSLIDALAMVETLGTFGQQNLQFAALFDGVNTGDPEYLAYAMYRNYDGAATPGPSDAFGNTSVTATSSNQPDLSIYAALRSSDGALTVIVVNKESTSYATSLTLSGFTSTGTADVYSFSGSNTSALVHSTTGAGATVSYTFPAYSATEFVFAASGSGTAVAPPTDLTATVE